MFRTILFVSLFLVALPFQLLPVNLLSAQPQPRGQSARPKSADRPSAPGQTSVTGVPLVTLQFTTANADAQGNLINARQGQCWGYVEDINGVKIELVEIPSGSFIMGSSEGEADPNFPFSRYLLEGERPPHRVKVKGFLIGRTEVTQAQWRAVARLPKVKLALDPDPAQLKGDDLPVERVSWEQAVEFCERLSRKTGGRYRLPSEAEWEYAARAGTTSAFAFGVTISSSLVNYVGDFPYGNAAKGEYRRKTVAAGSLPANAWGLHEMHGNLWEYCQDNWHTNYNGAPSDGSAWLGENSHRIIRGGSFHFGAFYCRSASRNRSLPIGGNDQTGFRFVRQSG